MQLKTIYISAILFLTCLINAQTSTAQSNTVNDVKIDLVPYVDQKNPTDTLLDYYAVVTLDSETSTPTLYVKAGTDLGKTDRLNNSFSVTDKVTSIGTTTTALPIGVANTKKGNTVRIYIGRNHFEFIYCEVSTKDTNGNTSSVKLKDMRKD